MRDLDLEEDQLIQTRQQISELSAELTTLTEALKKARTKVKSIAEDFRETGKMPPPPATLT